MIGRGTLFWILLAATVGFSLFHVKYKVQTLEDDLNRLNAEITKEQEQLHVLRAEWAYLNQPARLQELSARHLTLEPLDAGQIGLIEDIPFRPKSNEQPVDDGEIKR
jgi:cell division protein FtsL